MRLLCLSNGHGEDAIALRILQSLQHHPQAPEIAALPIVGEGRPYAQAGIPIVGSVQTMPSGGFIYMDGRQLARDLRGGLLSLTWKQFKTVRSWAKKGGVILAVGDIVPLLFAWLSGAPYAFVGTAKSEYYVRDEAGWLPRPKNRDRLEKSFGSVYLPWERWLMGHKRCQAIFPRDTITTDILKTFSLPAFDLGNPMMDGLEPSFNSTQIADGNAEKTESARSLVIMLLPGSRPPEAYANWQIILAAVNALCGTMRRRKLVFLGAIAPSLDLTLLTEALEAQGWQSQPPSPQNPWISDPQALSFHKGEASLILSQRAFNDCLHRADFAIAMAGTATEQFIGLGKPAITLPGAGPQFNPTFAEAQTRLLGPSVILVTTPDQVPKTVQSLLNDPDRLQLIAQNGLRRMGEAGAAHRIAACLMEVLAPLSE